MSTPAGFRDVNVDNCKICKHVIRSVQSNWPEPDIINYFCDRNNDLPIVGIKVCDDFDRKDAKLFTQQVVAEPASKVERKPIKIIVTGGRYWSCTITTEKVLRQIEKQFGRIECIVNGGAQGADLLAREWAERNKRLVITVNAKWVDFGKAAGPMRN